MVLKHCPDCKKTLAVACKTCPECHYVFQAKKTLPAKPSENEDVKKVVEKEHTDASNSLTTPPVKKRGRPKGSKDKQKRLPKGYKQLKIVRNMAYSKDAEWTVRDITLANGKSGKDEKEDKDAKSGRKRGRPRGSKNKTTHTPMFYAEDFDEFDSDEKEDSYNLSEENFYIPADKREKFSLILSDINSRIVGQAFPV